MTVLDDLLVAEHQAVYAYGVIGAHLAEGQRELAQAGYDAHRQLRDSVVVRLAARNRPTPGPATSYALAVTTARSAVQQAVRIEEGVAVLWRDLVASTDDKDLRGLAVRALADAAVRAVRWRRALGIAPTVAFPGRP